MEEQESISKEYQLSPAVRIDQTLQGTAELKMQPQEGYPSPYAECDASPILMPSLDRGALLEGKILSNGSGSAAHSLSQGNSENQDNALEVQQEFQSPEVIRGGLIDRSAAVYTSFAGENRSFQCYPQIEVTDSFESLDALTISSIASNPDYPLYYPKDTQTDQSYNVKDIVYQVIQEIRKYDSALEQTRRICVEEKLDVPAQLIELDGTSVLAPEPYNDPEKPESYAKGSDLQEPSTQIATELDDREAQTNNVIVIQPPSVAKLMKSTSVCGFLGVVATGISGIFGLWLGQ